MDYYARLNSVARYQPDGILNQAEDLGARLRAALKEGTAKPSDICYHCKEQGHWKVDCPKLQAEQPEDVAPLNDDRRKNASDTQYRGAESQQLEQEHLHTLSLAETVLEQVQPGIHWRDRFVHRRSMIAACIPHIIAVGIGLSSVVIVARVVR